MIQAPDRIGPLIKQLEGGQPITPEDVNRVQLLQALDVLQVGRDFVNGHIQREADRTEQMRQVFENMNQ